MARRRGSAVWVMVSLALLRPAAAPSRRSGAAATTGAAGTYGESIESGIRLAITECREKPSCRRPRNRVGGLRSDPARAWLSWRSCP